MKKNQILIAAAMSCTLMTPAWAAQAPEADQSKEEIKAMLEEYSLELKNTEQWKRDPKAGFENLYKEWVQSFANDKGQFTIYTPVGCEVCNGSGYKGRMALYEIMTLDDEMRDLIMKQASTSVLRDHARKRGMRTLREAGLLAIYEGQTTIDEVVRETIAKK